MSKKKDEAPPLPWLPPRPTDSHKGDYGRALLVGGSRGMGGAIALAGMAALRSGAGLVTLGVPDVCVDVVAGFHPSYMTLPLPSDSQGRLAVAARDQLAGMMDRIDCLAVGPGLGRTAQVSDLVCWLYEVAPQPLVLDADALVALAERIKRLDSPAGPRILTPHPGEFARFVDGAKLSRDNYEQLARHLAESRDVVIVLKGHRSMITDGQQTAYNTTGNPGMATGGTGDVLTGVITALICQGLSPFEAAQLGTHVQGLAGDLAAKDIGQTSLTSLDVVHYLPQAFLALEG